MEKKERYFYSCTIKKGLQDILCYVNYDDRTVMFARPTQQIAIVKWDKFQPKLDELHRKYDNVKKWVTPDFIGHFAAYIKTLNNYLDVNNMLSIMLWDLQRKEGFDMSAQITNYYSLECDLQAWYDQLPENAQYEVRHYYMRYITKYMEYGEK